MIKRATAATWLIMLLGSACTPLHHDEMPLPTVTMYSQGPLCLDESQPVPAWCYELHPLPQCATEDDAIDGASGPACWWRNDGQLWYNDGNGSRG